MKNAPPQPLSSYLLQRCLEKGRKQTFYPGIGDGSDDYGGDPSGAPGGQLLPWYYVPPPPPPHSMGASNSQEAQEDETVGTWQLPEYVGVGLPGSPSWTHATHQKALIYIADRYREGLHLLPRHEIVPGAHQQQKLCPNFSTADVLMLGCLVRHASCKLDTIALVYFLHMCLLMIKKN
jgi:hypothetical protein